MDDIGERSWKAYYADERVRSEKRIDQHILDGWKKRDTEVDRIVEIGGVLSFPHTYLDSSLDALVRISLSLYRNEKLKVMALGVLHGSDPDALSREFSLDNFEYVTRRTGELLGRKPIDVVKLYPSEGLFPIEDNSDFIEEMKRRSGEISQTLDENTAVVMTGDLCHYGHGYRNFDESLDAESHMRKMVQKSMRLLYRNNDPEGYLDHCKKTLNDQMGPALAAISILGGNIHYRIFNLSLTDYSKVLNRDKPTMVSSVFYGIWRVDRV